jgi:hypothetical protein
MYLSKMVSTLSASMIRSRLPELCELLAQREPLLSPLNVQCADKESLLHATRDKAAAEYAAKALSRPPTMTEEDEEDEEAAE